MSVARSTNWSFRLERAETSRLAWAFALSVALHIIVAGTYETGKHLRWWERLRMPAWLHSTRMLNELVAKKQPTPPQPPGEPPLVFVDVNPDVATPEPPKNAPY